VPGYDVTEPRIRCVLPFTAMPTEMRLLRRAALAQLGRWGMPAAADEVELLVTELSTNVLKHVGEGAPAALVLEWKDERIRLEVHDKSQAMPSFEPSSCEKECGRGLHLLAALTADCGAVLTAAGKAVWCELVVAGRNRRFERAVEVLDTYQMTKGMAGLPGRCKEVSLEESAVELIADLLHWTAALGRDPDDILDRAQMHYDAEADAA
jgi:hypothetical protein